MLDQSFSVDNFRRILDLENRKGLYLEGKYFPNVVELSEKIKLCNKEIRENKKEKHENEEELKKLYDKRDLLKQQKEELLTNELQKVSDNVNEASFKIELRNCKLIT